jgi:hypothetical protein
MKLLRRTAMIVGATATLLLSLSSVTARADSKSAVPRGQDYDRSGQVAQAGTQTFVGIVTETSSPPARTFIIFDDTRHISFVLSDSTNAQRFEGARVKVMGTVEQGDTTVRVVSIDLYCPFTYLRVGK